MKKRWIIVLALTPILTISFAWFVWPTPWTYYTWRMVEKGGGTVKYHYRVHRFTGEKQAYVPDRGWEDVSDLPPNIGNFED